MNDIVEQYTRYSEQWFAELEDLFAYVAYRFGRREMQERALDYLIGLLRPVERKNGWQLAEATDHASPYSVQHLLDRAHWDCNAVRDDLVDYVVQELGSEDGVLAVDETGFLKKGRHSAGVQRQYSGTAGRIENCQIGVFLSYASAHGRALLDRELYLPKDWANDPERRAAAKIPDAVEFATKPQLARRMIERAVAAKVPFAWITGDEIYGDDRRLRVWLEQSDLHFVLAVASNQHVWKTDFRQATVSQLVEATPALAWQTLSAGDGAKGPRLYEWANIALLSWQMPGQRSLLLRRSLADGKLAYYVCYAPIGTTLEQLVRVAGTRWTIEECFEAAKGEVGLDQYEVRSWHGWYRHVTLAMLAHAYLASLSARAIDDSGIKKKPNSQSMLQWKEERAQYSVST
jgi:SRSO17 transposase